MFLWLEEGNRLDDSECLQALYIWMCMYIPGYHGSNKLKDD